MIRAVWVGAVLVLATLFFGLLVMVAAALCRRGEVYYWATQSWSRAILRASGVRLITSGLDGVDWAAPQILVSNHTSYYDVFALSAVLPKPFAFVGKKELNRIPFFGTAWRAAGHISIDRSDRESAVASLRAAGEKLRRERGTVVIFPEGTRGPGGSLLPFKKGVFALAAESGVPLLPTVVVGSDAIAGPGPRIRRGSIHIHFGDVVAPGESRPEQLLTEVRGRMERMLAEAGRP